MLARNYRRCSTLQNATGAFVGKVPAIGFHSVVGLRRVPRCRGAIQLRVPPSLAFGDRGRSQHQLYASLRSSWVFSQTSSRFSSETEPA